jgi:hypothetical protein
MFVPRNFGNINTLCKKTAVFKGCIRYCLYITELKKTELMLEIFVTADERSYSRYILFLKNSYKA